MTVQMTLGNWHSILNLTNKHVFQILFKIVFSESLLKKTTESLIFRNYPVGLSYNDTLKYWILKNNVSYFYQAPWTSKFIGRHSHLTYNRCHVFTPFILTRSTKRQFKNVALKLLLFSTHFWTQWNSHICINTQHTYFFREFIFFRCLNKYYFKIYNF